MRIDYHHQIDQILTILRPGLEQATTARRAHEHNAVSQRPLAHILAVWLESVGADECQDDEAFGMLFGHPYEREVLSHKKQRKAIIKFLNSFDLEVRDG